MEAYSPSRGVCSSSTLLVQGPRRPPASAHDLHYQGHFRAHSSCPSSCLQVRIPKSCKEKGQRAWPLLEGDFQEAAEASLYSIARTYLPELEGVLHDDTLHQKSEEDEEKDLRRNEWSCTMFVCLQGEGQGLPLSALRPPRRERGSWTCSRVQLQHGLTAGTRSWSCSRDGARMSTHQQTPAGEPDLPVSQRFTRG